MILGRRRGQIKLPQHSLLNELCYRVDVNYWLFNILNQMLLSVTVFIKINYSLKSYEKYKLTFVIQLTIECRLQYWNKYRHGLQWTLGQCLLLIYNSSVLIVVRIVVFIILSLHRRFVSFAPFISSYSTVGRLYVCLRRNLNENYICHGSHWFFA